MQSTSASKKFNMGYIKFPTAMLAKLPKEDEAPRNDGAVNFVPRSGQKRYKANALGILSVTHKYRSEYSSFVKLPHYVYERELGLSHATVNRNMAELRNDEILIRKDNVSDLYIDPKLKYQDKPYIVIYSFLTEKLELGRQVKKLTFNAVLLLSFMINHYFEVKKAANEKGRRNIKPEEAYFIGGKKRLATLLNVAESTANGAMWELLKTGAVTRKAYSLNEKFEDVITTGKGNSRTLHTCFVLSSKIIRMAEKVHARIDTAREQRAKRADKQAQREERRKAKDQTAARKKKSTKAEQRKREFDILKSLYDPSEDEGTPKSKIWRADLATYKDIYEPPEPPDPFPGFDPEPDGNNN